MLFMAAMWGRMLTLTGLLFVLVCWENAQGRDVIPGTVHTIASTECKPYFSFQTLTLLYSHRKVGQPGKITRIMNCSENDLKFFSKEDLEVMDTHIAPSFTYHERTKDSYQAYNRPLGIQHWFENAKPREEWILIIDPDMYFRHPILPEQLQLQEGWIMSAHYSILHGAHNELDGMHIAQAPRRNDTFAGNRGRQHDEAGTFHYLRRKDLERIVPLWTTYTEEVRENPRAWIASGEQHPKPGAKIWIAEMYGWAFATADLGFRHIVDPSKQIYGGSDVYDTPWVVHYGLEHKVLSYSFDKHRHMLFDAFKCPPWKEKSGVFSKTDGGVFPHPPHPYLVVDNGFTAWRYGQLLNIEIVNVINLALCERHRRQCPHSTELESFCSEAASIGSELREEFAAYDKVVCRDHGGHFCRKRAQQGDCLNDWLTMSKECRVSCGLCHGRKQVLPHFNLDKPELLSSRSKTLGGAHLSHVPLLSQKDCVDRIAESDGASADTVQGHAPLPEQCIGPFTLEKQLLLICRDGRKNSTDLCSAYAAHLDPLTMVDQKRHKFGFDHLLWIAVLGGAVFLVQKTFPRVRKGAKIKL